MKPKVSSFLERCSLPPQVVYFHSRVSGSFVCMFQTQRCWIRIETWNDWAIGWVLKLEPLKVSNFLELLEFLLPKLWFNCSFFRLRRSIFQVLELTWQFCFRIQQFFFCFHCQVLQSFFEVFRYHCRQPSTHCWVFQFVRPKVWDFPGRFWLNHQVGCFQPKAFGFFDDRFRIQRCCFRVGLCIGSVIEKVWMFGQLRVWDSLEHFEFRLPKLLFHCSFSRWHRWVFKLLGKAMRSWIRIRRFSLKHHHRIIGTFFWVLRTRCRWP